MRKINQIHIHCSATRKIVNAETIRKWHTSEPRNWSDIGYHFVITNQIEVGRILERVPASARGHNSNAIAICYAGGLNPQTGEPEDTRTPRQKELLIKLIKRLKTKFPNASIHGHRDLSPDKNNDGKIDEWEYMKQCPCFDAEVEYAEFQPKNFKPKSAVAQKKRKKTKKKSTNGQQAD